MGCEVLENEKGLQMREDFIVDTKTAVRRNPSANTKAALEVEFRVLQLYVQKVFQVKGSWQRNPATKIRGTSWVTDSWKDSDERALAAQLYH